MPANTCVTATLIRNKVYHYNFAPMDTRGQKDFSKTEYFTFERNVPKTLRAEIAEQLADELEELVEIEQTRDGEDEIERPVFRIDREAQVRTAEEDKTVKRVRMRLVSADEAKKPKLRPPPPGLKRRIGG